MGIPEGTAMKTEFFLEKVHPEDLHIVNDKIEEMVLFKKPVSYDLRLLMADKKYKWIQNNIIPEYDGENLVAFKGVNIDITEKKADRREH